MANIPVDILVVPNYDTNNANSWIIGFLGVVSGILDNSLGGQDYRNITIGSPADPSSGVYLTLEDAIQAIYPTMAASLVSNINNNVFTGDTFVLGSRIDADASSGINYENIMISLASKAAKTTTINGHALTSNVTVTKSDVGLGNVDNTTDANKPVSTATQTALNLKANTSSLSTVATTGSYNDLSNKPTIPSVARATSSLTLNTSGTGATGTQISSTKDSTVRVTYSTQVTITLGGSPVSTVQLKKCATNSATEGDWSNCGRTASTQPTTLSITVGGVYGNTGQICADIPAGWYVKAVASGSGTHSESFVEGEKTIYG